MDEGYRYSPEETKVTELFKKGMRSFIDREIVIYGIGRNTKAILNEAGEFNITGLMDASSTGQVIYGKPVVDMDFVTERKPVIVIVARDSVIPIIYKRISHLKDLGITILNYAGKPVEDEKEYGNFGLKYWNVTKKDLYKAIDDHDVISFDLFDTLIMRKVLTPDCVFYMTQRVISNGKTEENDFANIRRCMEKETGVYSDLSEIYEKMRQKGISENVLKTAYETELNIEKAILCKRETMVEAFNYAKRRKKQVYIVSDMHLSRDIMEDILINLGISGYKDILISCMYKKSKEDGSLYRELKTREDGKILHIGDNRIADGEMAEKEHIDTFLIYSAYEMFMASSMGQLLADTGTVEKNIILGIMAYYLFNDPFALSETKGMVSVSKVDIFGKAVLGPVMGEFIYWLINKCNETDINKLLLPARDGYLINELLNISEMSKNFDYVYFKCSRRAVSVASIEDDADIRELMERKYTGTYGDFLKDRFGIAPKDTDEKRNELINWEKDRDDIENYIFSYRDEILKNATDERKNYIKYLNRTGIGNEKNYGVYDFITGGTVLHYLEKLLNISIKGICFATMNLPNRWYRPGEIDSAFGNISSYGGNTYIGKHYLILESIMTDGYNTFINTDENGNMVYGGENGEPCDAGYEEIRKIQEAIKDYVRDMESIRRLLPVWEPDLQLADTIFGQVFEKNCFVSDNIKEIFKNDDIYMGVGSYRVWKD